MECRGVVGLIQPGVVDRGLQVGGSPESTGSDASISAARSIAAGDINENQMPPSEAKFFCGAK